MNQDETPKVIFKTRKARYKAGVIQLNSVRNLNALSTEMYELMLSQLEVWEHDKSIDFLWIESNSDKAFSAGGDVKSLALNLKKRDHEYARQFFTKEYLLDYKLSQYSKPSVAFGSGLVIGGGWGLFNACSFKIATETSSFCMPEITIGLFPDVGASYFLNQIPGKLGLFMGLTAHRISGGDAVEFNLADLMVGSESKKATLDLLLEVGLPGASTDLESKLSAYALRHQEYLSFTPDTLALIRTKFQVKSFDEIYDSLLSLKSHKALAASVSNFLAGAPVSQRVIYELLWNFKSDSLKDALIKEHALALHFMNGVNFKEGVRALLIDKDGSPNWAKEVSGYFEQALSCLRNNNEFAVLLND